VQVTVPNVIVNAREAAAQRPSRYFAGDWGSLSVVSGSGCYDVILTAETIYEERAAERLLRCMDELLAPGGVAYVAAKSYYFGVGGSTRQFEEAVARLTPRRAVSRATLIQVRPPCPALSCPAAARGGVPCARAGSAGLCVF
jgi:hypothetical protein